MAHELPVDAGSLPRCRRPLPARAPARRGTVHLVAHHRDPLDHPLADEVVDHVVLGEAVVPTPIVPAVQW